MQCRRRDRGTKLTEEPWSTQPAFVELQYPEVRQKVTKNNMGDQAVISIPPKSRYENEDGDSGKLVDIRNLNHSEVLCINIWVRFQLRIAWLLYCIP